MEKTKTVKLEDWELKVLKNLSRVSKLDKFLENRIRDWSDLDNLTADTFAARKDAIQLMRSALLDPISQIKEPKEPQTNQEYT